LIRARQFAGNVRWQWIPAIERRPGNGRKQFVNAGQARGAFFAVRPQRFPQHELTASAVFPASEERLCNYGASELLIPSEDLKERMQGKKPSLFTLRELLTKYGVSLGAMLLRQLFRSL
jgi:IrrE N-terminal-like domain